MLPGTDIRVKLALTFAEEMLIPVQICRGDADSSAEVSASAGFPVLWQRGVQRQAEGLLALSSFPLKSHANCSCMFGCIAMVSLLKPQ